MSDSLLMLLEMIEEVLEEQALISESTDGFAFERVIVDVAKFGSEAVKQGASTSGTAEWNKIPSSTGENLLASSIRALKQMGYDEEKIKGNDARGVDREASGFSTRGLDIRGMPKTDVIIKDKDGNTDSDAPKLPVQHRCATFAKLFLFGWLVCVFLAVQRRTQDDTWDFFKDYDKY